ncbi:hypothetical protein E2C01_058436 [Portunus trituberculatus]|uniref:Uncharacterized protein n=1 Tax=Portunus trituberculatus TaxID=210409 RepID=A0A5B7H642_PORTR|nr:hypothetical protein [Portunus trituberculatus]
MATRKKPNEELSHNELVTCPSDAHHAETDRHKDLHSHRSSSVDGVRGVAPPPKSCHQRKDLYTSRQGSVTTYRSMYGL